MRAIRILATLVAACIVMLACFYMIPVQRDILGEHQAVVLLAGEAAALICLGSIAGQKKSGREWAIASLVWLSLAPILFAVAYLQLPSNRLARHDLRVDEAGKRVASYRSNHAGASCPPLEAELSARQKEREAARIRYQGLVPYRNSFQAGFTCAGAISAGILAGLNFYSRRPVA